VTVYRIDAENGHIYGRNDRLLRGSKNKQGYIQIIANGKWPMAHRMIWESVHGPIPDGLEINHKNGIPGDNRIANLELVTKSENLLHAYRLGLKKPRRGIRSLTSAQVDELRQRRSAGERVADLAVEFGVCKTTAYNITGAAA
jgi:hypothetical protein